MKFTIYHDWSELPKGCKTLFTKAEKDSVFFSEEWLKALTPHLTNQKQKLLLVCVIDDNCDAKDKSVLAILPLLTNENREWTSFTHPYSSLFTILLSENFQSEILNCLCQGLITLDFDYLTLEPISTDDDNLEMFQETMESKGLNCYRHHKAHNWFHQMTSDQSFADYMAERPSKIRNTILRKQRKLERDYSCDAADSFDIKLYIDEEIEQALASYHELYKVSWKANEQQQTLVENLLKRFSKRGWPRLAILSIEDKPIAAQLWFVIEDKASIFRLVYDEAYKDYSPGSILMAYLLEHVIDKDKVTEIDFLSGNDGYKKDWMTERRERQSLVCVNNIKKKIEEDIESRSIFKSLIKHLFNK